MAFTKRELEVRKKARDASLNSDDDSVIVRLRAQTHMRMHTHTLMASLSEDACMHSTTYTTSGTVHSLTLRLLISLHILAIVTKCQGGRFDLKTICMVSLVLVCYPSKQHCCG